MSPNVRQVRDHPRPKGPSQTVSEVKGFVTYSGTLSRKKVRHQSFGINPKRLDYLSGVVFHCGGTVFTSRKKVGDWKCFRPAPGQGESYEPSKCISPNAILGCGPTSNERDAAEHVYDRVWLASNRLTGVGTILTVTSLPGAPNSIVPPCGGSPEIRAATAHVMEKLFRAKSTLLFVTSKGTANGYPKDGGPALKVGAVGQSGPPKRSDKPDAIPIIRVANANRLDRAIQYGCVRINWSNDRRLSCFASRRSIFSLGVAPPMGGFLLLTANASVACVCAREA